MEEVLDSNFEVLYPQIENAVNNANFITIDAEFSGMYSEKRLIHRLDLEVISILTVLFLALMFSLFQFV